MMLPGMIRRPRASLRGLPQERYGNSRSSRGGKWNGGWISTALLVFAGLWLLSLFFRAFYDEFFTTSERPVMRKPSDTTGLEENSLSPKIRTDVDSGKDERESLSAHSATEAVSVKDWKAEESGGQGNLSITDYNSYPRCGLIITFVDQRGNGFGAQVNRVLEAAAYARLVRAVFIFPRQRYWNYGCARYKTWTCYFLELSGMCVQDNGSLQEISEMADQFDHEQCVDSLDSTPAGEGCWVAGNADSEKFVHDELIRYEKNAGSASMNLYRLIRDSANQIIRLNPALRSLLIKVRAAVNFDGPFIGVHIRRGDKYKEVPLKPTTAYAELVRLLSGDMRDVFVATDDFQEAVELRKLLRPSGYRVLTLATDSRTGHQQNLHNRLRGFARFESTVEFLLELCILAESELFIAALSSNAARLTHAMRSKPHNQTISVDDRWLPGVAYHTFGQSYCEDPEANKIACGSGLY